MFTSAAMPLQEAAYHPHGVCYLWQSDLLWTHVAADGMIALAYYSIPVILIYFIRKRRDLPFNWIFVAFALFILACGTTHAMAIWTLWNPDYWWSAGVKIVTAGASLATAGLLVPLVPKAIALPSPSELRSKNRELEEAHAEIEVLNRSLQARLGDLETANADLEAFAHTISHDLQAPLLSLEGFSVALREDCSAALDEDCRDYVERIEGAARRMSDQIQDLLAYSRLARGDIRLHPVPLDELFGEVRQDLSEMVAARDAELRLDGHGLVVEAHRSTLARMLVNLISNALTYVEEGVRPVVRVRARRTDEHGQGTVRVSVEDNGIGIAEEHHRRIFRIFERLHGLDRFPGSGIGLAAVAKGAERMGGEVGVRSEPGEGSEFWIDLQEAG